MNELNEEDKDYYVLLTGSKNNAGDYLIKYRAKLLFDELRKDRKYVDVDAWKPFDDETLTLVNNSKAVILMGGPALQRNMHPHIYPLTKNLDNIKAPIVTMGIGWKSNDGSWRKSRDYPLTESTLKLLEKIDSSGIKSSVRDYHTLNALQHKGFKSFVMTGCPAFNDFKHLENPTLDTAEIKKIAFSLGVSFLESNEMLEQMRSNILGIRDGFPSTEIEVVFHHALSDEFLTTHNATDHHLAGHRKFADWLTNQGISFVDISGSAENLVECYSNADLHVGYRVHAHIFMTSIGKRSLLIAEDGRGKGVRLVMDGLVLDGVDEISENLFGKILRRLKIRSGFSVDDSISNEVLNNLNYEIKNSYPRMRKSQILLKDNFRTMEKFLLQLP